MHGAIWRTRNKSVRAARGARVAASCRCAQVSSALSSREVSLGPQWGRFVSPCLLPEKVRRVLSCAAPQQRPSEPKRRIKPKRNTSVARCSRRQWAQLRAKVAAAAGAALFASGWDYATHSLKRHYVRRPFAISVAKPVACPILRCTMERLAHCASPRPTAYSCYV